MKRPLTLTFAAVFMLVLALLVGGFAAARQFGLLQGALGMGRPGTLVVGGEMPRNFEGRAPGEMPRFEQGGQGFIVPGEEGQPGPQVMPGDGSGPTIRRFGNGEGGRVRSIGRFPMLAQFGFLQNWPGIGLGLLGLAAAFLLWRSSRWGIILSIVLSLLIVLVSIPGLLTLPVLFIFPAAALWNVLPSLLQLLLALTVLVLVLLPASRRASVAHVAADDDEMAERIVL